MFGWNYLVHTCRLLHMNDECTYHEADMYAESLETNVESDSLSFISALLTWIFLRTAHALQG